MLERFKVPIEDAIRVDHDSLQKTVYEIFQKMGVPNDEAKEGSHVLTMTDLRAVETHGVSNMMRRYVQDYSSGNMNPSPNIRVIRETPGIAVLDGDRGLGITIGKRAMDIAIEKASNTGIGVVAMRNSGHLGAVGHFAMLAAQKDMVGICMTAGGDGIAPTFGGEGKLGANPISFAAPTTDQPTLMFDVATSSVAMNKLTLAKRVGTPILPGWIANKDGTPIMEEIEPPAAGEFLGLPFGGTRENGSHKGYGFSLMVEVLGSLLAGSVPTMLDVKHRESMFKHHFAAYDIKAFTDLDMFKSNMDQMLETLRNTKPSPGHTRVIYPGLAEYEDEVDRRSNGIPLHKEVVEWFDDICGELSVSPLKKK